MFWFIQIFSIQICFINIWLFWFIQVFSIQICFINIWLIVYQTNNAFVFPDREPPIINILCGCSGIYDQLRLYCVFFFHQYNHRNLSFLIYIIMLFLLLVFLAKSYDTIVLFVLSLVIFAVSIPPKVVWHNYFICIATHIFLL